LHPIFWNLKYGNITLLNKYYFRIGDNEFIVYSAMILHLHLTSKSSLCYGSTIKGWITAQKNGHTYVKLMNGLDIKISDEEIISVEEGGTYDNSDIFLLK